MHNLNVNEAQSKAISHREGPMLVLAGPGSGKTLVITQRIKYLIEEGSLKLNYNHVYIPDKYVYITNHIILKII